MSELRDLLIDADLNTVDERITRFANEIRPVHTSSPPLSIKCRLERVDTGHYEFFVAGIDSPLARITLDDFDHQTRQLATLLTSNPVHEIALDSYLTELARYLSALGLILFSPELVRESRDDAGEKERTDSAGEQKHPDSGHYAYSPDGRREIVEAFRKARRGGKVKNMDTWARVNYGISERTLRRYLEEYPPDT